MLQPKLSNFPVSIESPFLLCYKTKYIAYFEKKYIIILVEERGFIMNKEELISEISKKAKVSKKDAGMILSATIDTIEKSVKKGNKVTLVGFGTFDLRHRKARTGRNPQTGKAIKIAAKKVPTFSAGKSFKELVK